MTEKKSLKCGIFIFRKDLRFEDNKGLNRLKELCEKILPIFIFDPAQVDQTSKTNNYISFPALRFICEGVKDLSTRISDCDASKSKLYVFYGNPVNVLDHIIKTLKKKFKSEELAIGFNADYTEYSIVRDNLIEQFCSNHHIELIKSHDDYVLVDMEKLLKEPNIPYKQYGAFRKNILTHKKDFFKPIYLKLNNKWYNNLITTKSLTFKEIDEFWQKGLTNRDYNPIEIGTRELGQNILKNLSKFKDYNNLRDTLSYQTTHISAYLNFGLISEREFYWGLVSKLGYQTQLINQIFWREYYLCLLRYATNANSYSLHIDPRYNKLKWTNQIPKKSSNVWKEWECMMKSQTGFLLVDAGIQELLSTGFMHNRVRMIVGVFSVKYLEINPLCRYIGLNDWFSRYLVDCCTSQNKLNSQWITELDFPGKKFSPSNAPIAGRPMNISNVMIKKWDHDCMYIKKWLPHLANVDNKILIGWDTKYDTSIHPKPIFDPKQRYLKWIEMCKV